MKIVIPCAITSVLLLAACARVPPTTTGTPMSAVPSSSSSSQEATMDVNHRLSSLQLPDGWSAAGERSGFVWFALPSVYSRIDDPYLDHNFFTVHPMVSDVCDKRYADAQAAMQAGTPIPPVFRPSPFQNQGKMVGYTWLAYGGAGASGPPDWREWCVHVATSASDLDITAIKADTRTVSFIEHTFIPLWIKEFP